MLDSYAHSGQLFSQLVFSISGTKNIRGSPCTSSLQLLCTGLLIWNDLLIRLLKAALKSTDHGMLISVCYGLLISTLISTDELINRPE